MSLLRMGISMSLDGFVAGASQSVDNPIGIGGMRLHEWVFPLAVWRAPHGLEGGIESESSAVLTERLQNVGATIMGRNMFGGGTGPWDSGDEGDVPWNGWWGDEPPFHHPVFVLTRHPREPLVLGETTFTFVTDGIASALAQARDAAGHRDITIGGGAATARQYLAAGLVDRMEIDLVPVFLGEGERLLDGLGQGQPELVHVRTVAAPGVTHLLFERA